MGGQNPFLPTDADRHAIWEILVRRDSAFFLSGDWSLVADDYVGDGFLGIDAGGQLDPAAWKIGFASLAAYRDAAISGRLSQAEFSEDLATAWLRCQTLTQVTVTGDLALAHKHIDGEIARFDREPLRFGWRSIFFMRRVDATWKISGFAGYLPL